MNTYEKLVDLSRNNIPKELQEYPQWVCWVKRDKGNGRMDKLPIISGTSDMASVDEPGTWGDFDTAWKAYEEGQADGVGFVVSKDDPFCGIDLDDCLNPETGEIEEWALDIISRLSSYTEMSPSGRGIRIFVKARKPGERCKLVKATCPDNKGKMEIYDSKRFFTLTGNVFGCPSAIEERQQEIEELYYDLFGHHGGEEATMAPQIAPKVSDEMIAQMAFNAGNGSKFRRLMAGNTTGYTSNSEADLALASILAFYTRDPDQIYRIIQRSGLYDEKWDRPDYRDRTIQKAMQSGYANPKGRIMKRMVQ